MTRATVPDRTVRALARSIFQEAKKYGFTTIDTVRLINALMDMSIERDGATVAPTGRSVRSVTDPGLDVTSFPLRSERLSIRRLDPQQDVELLKSWMSDRYGRHFLLSCATAQETLVESLYGNPKNHVGLVLLADGTPIGAVAFLDFDPVQRRAELRKLIGVPAARGKGFAEEATVL